MTLFHAPRALTVRSAAIPEVAGAPALVPLKLAGREGVNSLFEYRLILQTPDAYNFKAGEGANFDLDAFIGLELTCGIELEGHGSFVPGMPGGMGANQGAGEREISGLITRARFIGESSRHALYEFTLRPWLHLATLTTDCRVYQDQSPVEIIEAVLARYAFAADRRLIETYPRRDYTVQYNESDFEFVTRLMQEWGINYHFEHSGGVHRLVWSDHKGAFQPTGTGTGPRTSTSTGPGDSAGAGIGTNANAHHRIPFYPLGHKIDREYIHGFSPTDALTTRGSYGSRDYDYDYDYTRPRAILDAHAYVSQLIPPPSERRPMIISPPFLPDRAQLSEDAWLDIAMAQPLSRLSSTGAPEGSFPLSLRLAWHNGLHIQAPQPDGSYLPVRAIADGKVVYVHAPTTPNADVTHALNYNPFGDGTPSAAWTSDGFVVIRHTTEIGAAGSTPTEVSYFSAYMHLSHIANCPKRHVPWEAGDDIHRKDELGAPGRIYGHGGQIHFEICCDEANLRQFVPRAPAWTDPLAPVAPSADGRTDSVFGSMYVYLPAGTPTSATPPSLHVRAATSVGAPALPQPQWVQITYDMGSAILGSHTPSGEPIGKRCHAKDFEYNLYAKANERHGSLDATTQALSSPSGWYELLRFGRNLGPDPLPAHAAHWREIPTATGTVWADLNAEGTFKFSDADFPAFKGGNCFDDDGSPTDQRCDSLHLKTLIRDPDPRNDRRMEPVQLARRLGEPTVRTKLRQAICQFPSEWDQGTIVERYSWLLTEDFKSTEDDATGAKKWERFVNHARAISILEPAGGVPQGGLAFSSEGICGSDEDLRVVEFK